MIVRLLGYLDLKVALMKSSMSDCGALMTPMLKPYYMKARIQGKGWFAFY
jgi:hypothetical protein